MAERAFTESGALYLGVDFGTSGCRIAVIDDDGRALAFHSEALAPSSADNDHAEQDPQRWWQTLVALLRDVLDPALRRRIAAIAVDGTSASLLLCDADGQPVTPCLMYNDSRAVGEAARIDAVAPADNSAVRGPSSALAKLLYFESLDIAAAAFALHQADWVANRLMARFGVSDANNCLKLGYDAIGHRWPPWLTSLLKLPSRLPHVCAAGSPLGPVSAEAAQELSLPATTQVVAGTTDSIAGCLAAGAHAPGDAVTSLGSTLVVKLVCERPISAPEYGIYSHPYGDYWLAGGASNCGGAVLLQYFEPARLARLSEQLHPQQPTGLDYYPLPAIGERFPYADPTLAPRLTPRPPSDVEFLQAILEGISNVEHLAYQRLLELGANPVRRIFTVGGGSRNQAWTEIRSQRLGLPLCPPRHTEAAFGSAYLAQQGYRGLCR